MIGKSANGVWGEDPLEDGSDIYCVRAADFERSHHRVSQKHLPARSVAPRVIRRHQLHRGDLILEKSGGGEKQPVGMAVMFDLDIVAVCSNFCARIIPAEGVDSRFLTYVLAAAYGQGLTQSAIKQTTGIQNLDTEAFFGSPWAYPKLDEQRRIAEFLDAETARLDRIMNLRREQAALTEERTIARIFNTLRGTEIDEDRKPSGLDWLGDIPASWPVIRVSTEFDVQLGKMLNQERVTGEYLRPYLRVVNVQWDRIDTDDLVEMNFPPGEKRRYEILPGDLLINEGGSFPGRAAIWDGRIPEIYYQKALHRARSRGRSSVRWFYYCLRLALELKVFEIEGNSTTMTHLTGEQLAAHRFPFPERNVQDQLTRELDAVISNERALLRIAENQVQLLKERRQVLITAAVTGQVDVSSASGRGIEVP
ncbi:restriction endonuclease subunit S [Nonomuraea turkmeniaca]|nr:restriction endonuclease subunit S [Nonomuraea turkmeniaca]